VPLRFQVSRGRAGGFGLDKTEIFARLKALQAREENYIANVRGNSFKTINRWVVKRLTESEYTEFLRGMNPEVARTLSEAEARLWYPLGHLTAVYEHIVVEIGGGDPAVLEEVGAFLAEVDLGGVLKPLVAFISIAGALRRTPHLWPRYDDSGEFRLLSVDGHAGRAELELADYEGGPLHCVVIRAWLKRGCELLGGKDVAVQETRCRWREGGTVCRWTMTWR